MIVLAAAFFITAVLYASVGFGGGSTYSALLALAGVSFLLLPVVSLLCNIAVVSGSTVRFAKGRITPWRGAVELTALAAPAALLGGLTPIGEGAFFTILGLSLVLAGAALIVPLPDAKSGPTGFARHVWLAAMPLGYLAGLVGIGGGIFLAPLLHLTRWREAREVAATASFFILINSIFGLVGQVIKNGHELIAEALWLGLPLILAVVVGGQIGSLMAVRVLPQRIIRWLTAALTIIVGARLLFSI